MRSLWQDIRYAVRLLAKNPAFTGIAVLTLALGIGANAAIFSVVNAALLRPLPYPSPEQLVTVSETRQADVFTDAQTSFPDYEDWTRESKAFQSLAGYSRTDMTLATGGAPEIVHGARITSSFFSTLGVGPALGRDFQPGEDAQNGPKIALVSNSFWRDQLGGNPAALGQGLRLSGEVYTVVGVLPASFQFAPVGSASVWLPLAPDDDLLKRRNLRWLRVIGRVKTGVTVEQAHSEMDAITARLAALYPQENGAIRVVMHELRESIVGRIRPLLLLLLGAVSFVLLIACANVANLFLARSIGRTKEIAVRSAIGASRYRLLRLLLTESLLLSLAGGAAGLIGAQWGVRALVAAIPQSQRFTMPFLDSLQPDANVFLFLLGAVVLTGLSFGLVPALQLLRRGTAESLKDESRTATGTRGAYLRDGLVVAQLAVSLVLLLGAGLMLRSMVLLLHQSPGFDSRNLLTFVVMLPDTAYKNDGALAAFDQRMRQEIGSLPGVEGVATVSGLPLTGSGGTIRFLIEGRPKAKGQEDEVDIRDISPAYFSVMKIPLQAGRFFEPSEDTPKAPPRVIVNKSFADHYFPGEQAVGKRVRFTYSADQPYREIVGVVGNENVESLDSAAAPILYASTSQGPDPGFYVVVRGQGSPAMLLVSVRTALAGIDPELPMVEPRTMERVIEDSNSVFLRRYPSYLIGSFAFLAVVLAMVGLYGQISYGVTQRTREIGIRVALGARPGDVRRLVMHRAIALAVSGLVIGTVLGLGLARLITNMLFGVAPYDPWTVAAVAAILMVVVAAASYVPVQRALKIDPMVALRYE